MSDFVMTIAGEAAPTEATFGVRNPATGEVFAQAPECTRQQLDAAFDAAAKAARDWKADEAARRALLLQAADVLMASTADLAPVLTAEQGKPLSDAGVEVFASAIWLQYFANLDMPTQVIQDDDTAYVELARRPLGVVAAITPWNFPLVLAFWKIAPALLAGNTLVLKPSPFTPLATLKVGEILKDVFPPGVVNIVSGGDDLGAWMTTHPVPRKISFTGSVETGKKVALSAAPDLKRVTLELGGNDPAIVLDDADPAEVATAIFAGAFNNNGQVCSAIKRVYVPEALYDDVVEGLAAHARSIKVGEGTEDGVKLGPINNEPQYERVKELVADALSHGATAVTGGKAMDRPGYFFEPTILDRPVRRDPHCGRGAVRAGAAGRALPGPGRRHRPGQRHPLRALGLGLGRRHRPRLGGGGAARVRHGVGQHALGAGSAAALRRLQVERDRRGERSLGPGRVLRVPGRAPLQGGRRPERQHRDAAVVTAPPTGRARGQPVVVVVVAAAAAA